ncbi:MAG: hypothetical protein ACI8RD_005698 [Bacillariaceae sp.]|jgi:hypothetical protein
MTRSMASSCITTQFLLLAFIAVTMAPVTAFGSTATTTSPILSSINLNNRYNHQQQQQQHSTSSFLLRRSINNNNKFASRSSCTNNNLGMHTKMCASISAPSLSLVSNVVSRFRGGGATAAAATTGTVGFGAAALATPTSLFNTCLLAVAMLSTTFKVLQLIDNRKSSSSNDSDSSESNDAKTKPASVIELQRKFLSVFWLLRCADWLQGPYFYEVYASKIFGGAPASMSMVSRLFLTGFASTALFGPAVGRAVDTYGRKKGTLAFSIIYAIGALSTKSPLLLVLLFGRVMSGIGTSLLFSAPESWLVGESQKSGDDPNGEYLGETFGMVCTKIGNRNRKRHIIADNF